MKVALVHDFLNQVGGAEKVLEIFHQFYPEAPVYTITYDKEETKGYFKGMKIKTSFIQRLPGGTKRYKWYLPLMPSAIEKFDLADYDLVISDSSAYAKGVITNPETLHICYCHSPTRYLWNDTHKYTEELKQPGLVKQVVPIFLNRIRVWDRQAADRVDKFIANSKTVAGRIKKYYGKNSEVIYPPVETKKFSVSKDVENYYLIVSRLRPYKRVDLAIQAFNALGYPLKIIGTGEEYKKLKKMANSNIEFLGPVSDKEKNKYLSRCLGFINPQEEDFGIAPVEAMASGRPVIAFKKGGARETVIEGKTGTFFAKQTPWSLVDVMRDFNPEIYNPARIKAWADQFDISLFEERLKDSIDQSLKEHQDKLDQTYNL